MISASTQKNEIDIFMDDIFHNETPYVPVDASLTPLEIITQLSDQFAFTAVTRDGKGGTPKHERDAIRQSGLLSLIIPKEYGGLGSNWEETMQAIRILASVDSSVAHVFGFQHLMLATVRLFASKNQWETFFKLTAKSNWFWGNALNPLDKRTISTKKDN